MRFVCCIVPMAISAVLPEFVNALIQACAAAVRVLADMVVVCGTFTSFVVGKLPVAMPFVISVAVRSR